MAASEETCDGNPNFAIICSFITKFGDDCGVNISIPYLQQMLEDTKNVNEDLSELLIHLLRRGRKRVTKERWEKCLIKFCHEYSSVDAWELERFGFIKAKLSVKLEILKRLLELQFDSNAKFKAEVNKLDAGSLRLLPLGKDIDGHAYWYQLDKEYNLRLYQESFSEEGSWQLVCSNTEDIRNLLTNLEKKYSGTSDKTCEDKSDDPNNPKSPSSDMLPVPKKEFDTEDLTSHLSESKPCTIIIKTEKRDSVSHSESLNCVKNDNCAIENERRAIGCELDNNTKGSVKLKLKLEPSLHSKTVQKSPEKLDVESDVINKSPIVLEPEPMEIEETAKSNAEEPLPASVPVNDVEMVEKKTISVCKVKSEDMNEEQNDQKFSNNNNNNDADASVIKEYSDDSLNHHKNSKIKLYEKWSNEKKKIDTSQTSALDCSVDSKTSSVVEKTDPCSVSSNQKSSPAIPPKCPSDESNNSEHLNKQTDVVQQSVCSDVETAVDLSKSSRVNVIVQNVCSKSVLSSNVSSTTKSTAEKSESKASKNVTSSLETDKSDFTIHSNDRSRETSLELKKKTLEHESKKVHKKSENYSDTPVKTNFSPGFSHLQALQNMCESNSMGGIPSVIQSTNWHSIEANRTVISENKSIPNNDIRFENMSKKYNFNDIHSSNNKTHSSDCETTNVLLKSNIHEHSERRKESKLPDCQTLKSPKFILSANEQELSQEAPTDLSCSAPAKLDNSDHKSSENIHKSCNSSLNKKDSVALKKNSAVNVEKGVKSIDKATDLTSKSDTCSTKKPINECDSLKEQLVTVQCSSKEKITQDNSIKGKESSDAKDLAKDLCCKKIVEKSCESAISSGSDISSKPAKSSEVCKDFSHVKENIAGFAKEYGKDIDVSNLNASCNAYDKFRGEKVLDTSKRPTNSSNSSLKEFEIEQINLENNVQSQFKSDSSLKTCSEFSKSEKKESQALENIKSKDVYKPKIATENSKSKETCCTENEKSSKIELNRNSQSEIGDKNISNDEKNKKAKFAKNKLDEDKMKSNEDIFKKSNSDISSTIIKNQEVISGESEIFKQAKVSHKSLVTNDTPENSKESTSDIDKKIEEVLEKTRVIEKDKVCVIEKNVKNVSEKEIDVKKVFDNENFVKKVSEKENESEKASVKEKDVKKASEEEKDVKKVTEKRKDVEKVSEKVKDVENLSENKDVERISETEKDAAKVSEKGNNFEKVSENEKDALVSEKGNNVEKVSEKEKDVKKMCEKEKDVKFCDKEKNVEEVCVVKKNCEKISEREKDVKKEKDIEKMPEKVCERENNTKSLLEKNTELKIISVRQKDDKEPEKKIDSEKGSDKDKNKRIEEDERKVTERTSNMTKENVSHSKKGNEKVSEAEKISKKDEDDINTSSKKKNANAETEIEKSVEKFIEKRKNSGKVSENEMDVEKVFQNERETVKKSECKKDAKVSKTEIHCEKVTENEKNLEEEPEKKNNEKLSEKEKDSIKISQNGKDTNKKSNKEKNDEKTSKKEKDVEKLSKSNSEKNNKIKFSENKSATEKESKEVKKVPEKCKNVDKIDDKNRDVENVSKEEEGCDKASENKAVTEKISGKECASATEKNKNKIPVADCKTTENVNTTDCLTEIKDVDNEFNNEKDAENLSEKDHVVSADKKNNSKVSNNNCGTTKDVKEVNCSSSKRKDAHTKSEKSNKLSTSVSKSNKDRSPKQKHDSDYKNKPCSPKMDDVEELKCESQNDDNEKSLRSVTCSAKSDSEEKIGTFIDEKGKEKSSESKSEQVLCEPQNTDCSTESGNKITKVESEEKECVSDKKIEMSDSQLNDDEIKSENIDEKSDTQNDTLVAKKENKVSKSRRQKGRRARVFSPRRRTRNVRNSVEIIEHENQCDTVSNVKEKSSEISTIPSTKKEISSSKNIANSNKNILSSEIYESHFKIYNLRHSACLETKFKHPFCDKYIKNNELKNVPVLSDCITELTKDEDLTEISPPLPKTRLRGKISKQPVNKKPQPVTTPVTKPATPATPVKKTPASNTKKKPNKTRKKEDPEKDDFGIPEGFLEILGNAENTVSEKAASGRKRKGFEFKDIITSQPNSDSESTPIKRSRRIQAQHQKKMSELAVEMEREQRILEQLAKRSNNAKKNGKSTPQKSTPTKLAAKGLNAKNNAKDSSTPTKSPKARAKIQAIAAEEETCMESRRTTRKMNSRSKNLTKMTLMYEDESKDSQFSTSRETEGKSRRRRRGRGQKKGFKPWDVSSESESSIEELTEEEEEEPEEPLIFDQNEDEFACEEEDPNAEPVIVRRARTAKKTIKEDTAEEECINDDTPCQKCGKYDKPEWILLCDKCDSGYHTHCLIPPLMIVPDGDWFCQPCEHMSLCRCLHEELNRLEVILKQKEREALRKQRLAYVGISLDNVLKPDKKEKSDESEKEEVKQEEEEEERKPQRVRHTVDEERNEKLYGKRSVRARRTVNYQFKEYDALIASALQEEMIDMPEEFKEDGGSDAGSDKPFTAKVSKRKRRGRSYKDFDSTDEEDSEDNYQGGSTDSEATMPPSSNSGQEESGSGEWKITKSRKKPQRKSGKTRRRRKRGGYSSEEDWEDEVVEKEAYRPSTRRAAQAVSYRELSSEDEEEWDAKPKQVQKRRKASSSESEASFKRKPSKKKRIRKWASSDSSESEEEKSMSSSEGEESEEEGSQEDDSEKEWKIDQKKEKIMRLKSNTNKKLLSSEEDEESTQDSAPKKLPKKVISDESEEEEEDEDEEEEEDEEDEEESESEENSEESEEEEDEEQDKEKKAVKKTFPEKTIAGVPIVKNVPVNNSKPDADKNENPSEKVENISDRKETLSITERKDFQPKVLVKKELCSVDIPLEPNKQTLTITPVVEKAPPKTVRKETTKMVPCVIPYDKSPKSGHVSNPEEDSDEIPKEVEKPHHVPPPRPAHFPKQGAAFTPPSSRIQFGGVLARHSVPPLSSPLRPPAPPRMLAPTTLSPRSTAPSVVVRHTTSPSNLPVRPNIPSSSMPPRPSIPSSGMPAPPSTPLTTSPQTQTEADNKPYKSTIMEPFSNMDDDNESDDEVPLERIPTACVPTPLPNRPVSYEREAEYRPAAKELSTYSYAPPEEKPFPGSYSTLGPFQDYSARPSPLKPSLVETYPNNSSPSKLTPLDTYSQTSSPKGFISLDSYSENRKKKHFYGNTSAEAEPPHKPASSSENYQGGEIRFPPEPYPCPQSPNTYPNRSPSPAPQRDPGTPPRLYSQFPDAYAPPRSPEYYQNHQYYASEERIPRPSYQPNYAPQEPSFVSNPYVATPVPQPNGGFMIDTLLRARNHENEEDELTGVTDIVSYITQE